MTAAIVHLPAELAIGLRPHESSDTAYIMRAMKEVLRQSPTWRWARDGEIYRALNHRCDSLLHKHGALIACNPDPEHESQLLGFAIIEKPRTCHFVYVLKPYRGNGVAKALLAGLAHPIIATHWTNDCEKLQGCVRVEYRPSLVTVKHP
jgi:GNAT superfamily N-acetyltransferase